MEFENISELDTIPSVSGEDEMIMEGIWGTFRISLDNVKQELDKYIPDDGIDGPKGESGQKGEPGLSGHKGSPGAPGPRGSLGQTGPKGVKGYSGLPGQRGEDGIQGDKGQKGSSGPKGYTGHQGHQGERGVTGPDAEDGSKGLMGIPGAKGRRGETGQRGDPGESNSTQLYRFIGDKGDKGNPGSSGYRGDAGDLGLSGRPGAKGKKGQRGDVAVRKNKVDYPVYGAKLNRNWESIWELGLTENHTGLDYFTKKDYLTDDYAKLKYKFIKVILKPNDDYISDNIVEVASPLTCILMIPGKFSRWSPVVHGAPPIVWYKRASDQRNNKHMRHVHRQGAQIYVDADNRIANESTWPDDKIRFTIQKPRQEFGASVNPEIGEFKILAIYGTNDL